MTSSPSAYSSFLHLLIFSPPLISSSEVKLLLLRPLQCQRELLKRAELYSLSLVYYSIVQIRVYPANCNFHLEIYAQAELKTRQVVFVVCITTSSWRRLIRKQRTLISGHVQCLHRQLQQLTSVFHMETSGTLQKTI